jgi:hypothetical protein
MDTNKRKIRVYSCEFVGNIFFLAIVFCSLIFLHAAQAATGCSFRNAEYIPDPKDARSKRDYYYYTITVEPNYKPNTNDPLKAFLVLNITDPQSHKTETKLRMGYTLDRDMSELQLAQGLKIDVRFYNKDFIELHPASGTDDAPYLVVMPDSYDQFLNLPVEQGLNIEYLSDKKIMPGAAVEDHLELIPDTWVFSKCKQNSP